jgi:hypothetical protein
MIILLVSVPIEVRRQVEALTDPKKDRIVVGETCQDGAHQFRRENPGIVTINARAWDRGGDWDSRSLVEFLRRNREVTIIAISSFNCDRVFFEALGCLFCRPEQTGETLQPLLQRS